MLAKTKKEKESSDKFTIITDELYNTLCKAIQTLLKDSIIAKDITGEEIRAAREFAELKPEIKAAKELLKFLDGDKSGLIHFNTTPGLILGRHINLTFHDLPRTFMKNSLKKGIDVKVVAQITDDRVDTVMETYNNLTIDELKEEADKL